LLLGALLLAALAAGLLVLAKPAWAAPTFSVTTTASTSQAESPRSVTTADFDRDGDVDLGVANQIDDNFSVWKNNGSGSFAAPANADNFTVGDNPRSIATADFDGDGKPDVATANRGTGSTAGTGNVSVRLNTNTTPGTTSFGAATPYDDTTATNPVSIVAADFDGVNGPDLAVANEGSDNVSIFLNDADNDGSLTLRTPSPAVGDMPESIVAADFDGDGDRDLAIANFNSDTVSVLLNNGSGAFTLNSSPAVGDGPTSVTAADFNGDGIVDLATANVLGDTVSALLGNGNGGFGSATTSAALEGSSFPIAVTAADYDADGNTDRAVANILSAGTVFFLPGNGNGGFGVTAAAGRASYSLGTTADDNPTSITTADLNADGRPDLSTTNSGDDPINGSGTRDGVSVLLNTSAGTVANVQITKAAPSTVVTGQNFSYTLTVTNNSTTNTANSVVVRDRLPAGVAFRTTTGCSESGGLVTCNLGNVAAGATATQTINVTAPGTTGTIRNFAGVRSANFEPDTSNNRSSATTTVNQPANLSIDKTDSKDPVLVNENFSYNLSVSNAAGAGTATNVTVTDTLPSGVTLNGDLPADCTSTGTNPVTVTCDLGTVNAGQMASRTINVRAPGAPGTLSNTATVSSPRDRTDSSDTEQTTVVPAADLSITKSGPDTATNGQSFNYTLEVTNDGPNAAQNVVVEDDLPDSLTYNDGASTESCEPITGTPDPNDVRCTLASLAANQSQAFTINVTPTQTGTLANQASVSSDTTDPTPANNTSNAVNTTVNPAADLSITKEGPATVGTGQPFSYEFTVNNAPGAATATDVKVEDTLPEGVTLHGTLPGNCNSTGTGAAGDPVEVTCTLPDIPGGGSQSVSINVRAPNTPGTITNQRATVTSPNDPETASSNRVTTEVVPANLTITKEDSPDPVNVGQDLEYTVRVTNAAGGGDAANVEVADQLPANTTFVSVTPSQGTCPTEPSPGDAGGTVSCDLGTVAASGTATVTIVVKPTWAAAGTQLSNEASVQSPSDPGTSPTPKSATATTTVRPEADLSISKEGPAQATHDEPFEYRLIVTNNGPDAAQNVIVTDDLPGGVTYNDGASAPSCAPITGTPDPNDVRCTLASLAANQSRTFAINVTPTQTGSLSNTASVTSDTADPSPADNTSNTVNTTVEAEADLSIDKQAPAAVTDGQRFSYLLDVANDGPSAATGVVAEDELPEGVSFVRTGTDPRCEREPAPSRTVRCELGSLASGEATEVEITVQATQPGPAQNTASVTGTEPDPDEGNNTDTAITQVNAAPTSADLSIQKSAPPTAVDEDNFTYTLTVKNNGPDAAAGVVIEDELPAGVRFVSANGCAEAGGTVTCNVGTLASGATKARKIVVRAETPGAKRNTATVSSNTDDPNRGNNSSTAVTRVKAAADLSINKSAPTKVTDEQKFTYTLRVTNNGPSDAVGVTVTDKMPKGLKFIAASDECENRAGTVKCGPFSLRSGGAETRKIVVRAKTPGEKSNKATVSSNTTDPVPGNNRDKYYTMVRAQPTADLSLRKSAITRAVVVHEGHTYTQDVKVTYTLTVRNVGPDAATGVVIRDRLPRNVTFVWASGGCENRGHTVTCKVDALATGDLVKRRIVVNAEEAGTLRNTASVGSETRDPNADNNTDTVIYKVEIASRTTGTGGRTQKTS
jgi:large repetitive protein